MSNDFWSTLNKKKREELLKSTQTKDSSSVSKTSENLKTGDFWSVLNEDKKRELLSSATTEVAPTRTFMQDDDDIAPVKGGNKNSVFKSGGFSDGVDGVGDFFGDLGQTVLGTTADLGLGILKGAGRLVEGVVDLGTYGVAGVADLFGADKFAEKTKKVAQYSATDEWTKGATGYVDQYSVLGNKADMVSEGLGQVLGIIATGGAAGAAGLGTAGATALTTGLTGLSGMGSGMNEAYAMGASDGNAVAYGATVGSIEAVSEMIFGGLGKGFKALGVSKGLTSIDDVFAKKLSNAAAKFITSEAGQKVVGNTLEYAVKSGAEGLEEVISGFGSAIAKDAYLMNGKDEKAFGEILKDENLLEQFVVGSIVSGIAQGGDFISSTKNGRDFVSGLSKNEQTVVDKVYNDAIAKRETDGKKLTNKEKNEIYDSIIEKMDKGYIDIDTIEGVLGGDEYKAYKDNIDTTEKLKAELNELRLMKGGDRNDIQNDRLAELKAMNLDDTTKLTELRKKLDDKLSPMLKNSRLAESYNEIARKGQAFKADLTKYTGKQRAAVQRAIDSGVLNNTNRSHELVDTLSRIEADKGIAFDYTNNEKLKKSGFAVEGKTVNGFVKDGGVTLNVQSAKAWQSTVGHEITHVLEGTEAYGALREALYAYAESKGELESRKTALTELYNGMNADIDAELTADLVGDYLFTDKDFINRLTGNRNLFQKVYDEIKYLCKVATGKEKADIEKVKREFERALRESAESSQNAEHNEVTTDSGAEKGGVSYDETSESYSPVRYSLSTWNKSDYVSERNKAASDMAKALGVTEEKASEYIDSVNSIAKMVADDKARLDYEASPGRSAFVSNAEYGGSIDFSTICKKRRLFTGTFEAIQNALPNTALTAEEVLEIRKMMKDKGYEVSCGLCYVEGSRANMGQFTKQFIERYKATNPAYVPNMAEMNTATGQEQIRKEHPEVYEAYEYFMNHYGKLSPDDKALFASQQKPKMYQMATEYNGEILDKFGGQESSVAEKNKKGGLRLQSFSDFEIIHLIDSMQVIMDMSRVGLAGQAYTKVPDFAWALGDTGLKINLSLIAKDVDANGRLVLDEVEGMKESDAMALRDRYSDNVGTILVVFTDEQLKAAMADERIDYIIPYHRSQWKTSQYESMGLPENTKDYTAWQNESFIEPVYNKNGKKQRPNNYMPNSYWDPNKSGKENAEVYLAMCAEDNRRPKFSHLLVDNGDGSYSLQPDGSTDGYWKTLIDFKMYNNDGIGVPQNPVVPNFNMEEAQRMLNEYTGGHAKFPVAKDIVDEFVSKHPDNIAPTEVQFSLSKGIDKNADLGYNGNEMYTVSDRFVLEVDKNDRDVFARSLANKTADLKQDEIRTVEIYSDKKVYYFKATGYMQGRMLYSANIDDVYEYRAEKKEYLNGNNSSRQTFGSWSSVLPLDGTGTRSDIHSIENGRTESDVYEVYGESRTRNSTGTQERIGENFRDDPEEVKRIIAELHKEYGITENYTTNEIAPIKEASSADGVFFDGENSKLSLSNEGEQFAPIGNYSTPANETALGQDIAPVGDGVVEDATTTTEAPMLEDIPILPDEELEQGTIAAIRPKPEKQPSMKRVNNAESKEHIAQVLTEEPKVEKKKKGVFSTLVRNFVDKGAVFENLSLKTKNRALQDTYKAMGRSETKAQYFMENGKEGVKPLNDIIAEVEQTGKTKEFYEYLYHKHNVDRMSLESRERPNLERLTSKMNELKLLNLQENQLRAIASEKITNETAPKRADLIKTVREYLKSKDVKNKPVFDYSVTAEMSQATANQLETKNPEFKGYAKDVYDYMNHLRQMMVDKGVISQETADLWAETYPYYVPIRRAGHDGLAVNVPLDTNKTGINAPIKRATGGNSDILPLFETMAQRTLQTFKAIDKNRFGVELKNTLGNTVERTTTNIDEVIDSIDAHESLLQEGKNGRNPTFTVFENGERVTFDITDEMYDALKPTSEGLSYTSKVLNTASNLHRGVLTEYSVPFMVTNAIKDAQDVLINSQHPAQTYANSPVAIKELITRGKWYTEYMENGGGDNTYFDKQTNTFNKEQSALRKIVGFPIDKISDANNFIEKVPRLAEYIASRKNGASIDAAMLDAARVTTDFSAGGDVTKFLNRNGATFLNASVQGFAQQVRNVREAKMNGLKGWLGLATKTIMAGLPAMLLNGLLWDDDEEYEELSDYVKENYYIVGKYGDGKFVRIPKGRTVAVIQNGFEQISNALTGDDEVDFGRFAELALSNLAPNNPIDNNIIAPIKQVMENKTWYGEDLVPTRLQDLPAAEQFDESTDAISKWLGENLNVSPYKVNYLLNQYSGGIGDIFLPMMTPEAESGDNSLLGNLIAPLKDKFTTDSVMNNQNVSDFYSKADELKVKANSSNATEEDILKNKYMNAVNSELSELYKAKREIQNSSLSDGVKYAQVREIQKQINALAKESLGTYDNVVSEDNYAKVGDKHYKQNDEGEWQKINDKQVEKQAPFVKVYGGYSSYLKYSSELYDIKADKDEYGKSISGSRKEKVLNYINNLDADYETKIILWKSEYPSDDTYNMDIINHLNNRADLTYEERVAILKELGFTVSGDTVYWD